MAKSQFRTTAAVLRSILNKSAEAMAEFVDCSISTIKSVESGRLKLSPSLAERMYHETGISKQWLLAGDPLAPPISWRDDPYTFQAFVRAQAWKNYHDRMPKMKVTKDFVGFAVRLRAILASADRRKTYHMTAYHVGEFLKDLEGEHGTDKGAPSSDMDAYFGELDGITREFAEWRRFLKKEMASEAAAQKRASKKGLPSRKISRRAYDDIDVEAWEDHLMLAAGLRCKVIKTPFETAPRRKVRNQKATPPLPQKKRSSPRRARKA